MCDTIVALSNTTKDGVVIFGKNSDREFNEAQYVIHIPRQVYNSGETLQCTHISIPPVKETYEIVLSKPYWIWGAEMGANEHGVCIGNETVFTKEPYQKTGLIGMDLLRLGLERGKTALEALKVMTSLLAEHGQGGTCSPTDPNYLYHNAYIIADPSEAWVLESADQFWAAEKVTHVRSISNALTITTKIDMAHPDLVSHAIEQDWCKDDDEFNFAACYADPGMVGVTGGDARQQCTMNSLQTNIGCIELRDMMNYLRQHGPDPSKWSPVRSDMASVCMHASSRALSQTCGSQVSYLDPALHTHWFTGTAIPCISLFKPVFLPNIGMEPRESRPGEKYDPGTLWWAGERLHRLVDLNYPARAPLVQSERDALETQNIQEVFDLVSKMKADLGDQYLKLGRELTEKAFATGFDKVNHWIDLVQTVGEDEKVARRMHKFFKKYNDEVGLTL